MDEKSARAWLRIVRDTILVGVATFVAIHETVSKGDPNFYLLAFSATLYGLPPVLRLDERRFKSGDEGKPDDKDAGQV